jgi:hypothetical protein
VVIGDGLATVLRSPAAAPPLPPSPLLTIGRSGAQVCLSWLVPSTSFVLKQNCDLGSTNWVNMTNQPTLDFSNLTNQVVVPTPLSNNFYRLATP